MVQLPDARETAALLSALALLGSIIILAGSSTGDRLTGRAGPASLESGLGGQNLRDIARRAAGAANTTAARELLRKYGLKTLSSSSLRDVLSGKALRDLAKLFGPGSGLKTGDISPRIGQAGMKPSGDLSGRIGAGLTSANNVSLGGSLNLSTEKIMTVEAERPAYWRQGSYVSYTGKGWTRPGEKRPYSEPVENSSGEKLVQTFHLKTRINSLVAAWKPQRVRNAGELKLAGDARIISEKGLEPGDSYTAVSRVEDRSPEKLREAGEDYPRRVLRYTELPDSVPERVSRKAAEVTSGADSNYDEAKMVENWLESNKEYSLKVDAPKEDFVDTFIFEMEKGYCAYYASAMTVMLRTQGIPARYVTGYTPGKKVNGKYVVRSMNAHAWVEVYFPGEGWVRFDPTPAAERQAQENQALGGPGAQHPGNRTDPGNQTDGPENQSATGNETESGPDISIEDGRPSAGEKVKIHARAGGEPVSTRVAVDGRYIGRTGDQGTIRASLPFRDRVKISLPERGYSEEFDLYSRISITLEPPAAGRNSRIRAVLDGRGLDRASVRLGGVYEGSTVNGSLRVQLPWRRYVQVSVSKGELTRSVNASLDATPRIGLTGETLPGRTVELNVTHAGEPLANASVSFSGEKMRTGANGTVDLEMPSEPGNYTIEVRKRGVAGSMEVRVESLDLRVDPYLPVALPGRSATVTASIDGEPLENVSVMLEGEEIGSTGPNGTLSTSLPFTGSATYTARTLGLRAERTISGMMVNLAALVLSGVLILSVSGFVAYRRGYGPRDLLSLLASPGMLASYLFTGLSSVFLVLTGGMDSVASWLQRVAGKLERAVRQLVSRGRTDVEFHPFRAAMKKFEGAVERVLARYRTLMSLLGTGGAGSGPLDLDRAWNVLKDATSLERFTGRTPGDVERHALEKDMLPEEPVKYIAENFRRQKYGPGSEPEIEKLEEYSDELRGEEEG